MPATFRKTITVQIEVEVEFSVDIDEPEDIFIEAWTCETDVEAAVDAAIEARVNALEFEMEAVESADQKYQAEARMARMEAAQSEWAA
jgi:hypothetical protein